MLSNAIRGHLAELGIISAKGRNGTAELFKINATTLWHFDAAEWAPSTASIASFSPSADDFRSTSMNGHLQCRSTCPKSATNGHAPPQRR
jgi:hypothetical protein